MGHRVAGWCVVVALLGVAFPARAYDPRTTHRWITRAAAEYLIAAYPGRYDELLAHLDEVIDGAEHEDDYILDGDDDPTTLRVMRHFYRPVDEVGLTYADRAFPSSYAWGAIANDVNDWDWSDGLARYQAGDLAGAYFTLGHVAHLIQDLTVPAHTHLDQHSPPNGDDYESYCRAHTVDDATATLPLPTPGAPIPAFATAREAWHATASAAYWRNLYPGAIGDAPSGVLAQMFPGLSWSWLREVWTIDEPPVGDLDEAFWEAEPGHFYFKNLEHPAAVDVAAFDPRDPRHPTYAANPAGTPMVELLADDLIPVAVLHTAGVMKLYLDQAYALEPAPEPEPEPEPDAATPAPAGCAAAARGGAPWLALAALAVVGVGRNRRWSRR